MITNAQLKELRWLAERNGSGVIDQYGRLLAGGETRNSCYTGSWLRLACNGYFGFADGRMIVTKKGHAELKGRHNDH